MDQRHHPPALRLRMATSLVGLLLGLAAGCSTEGPQRPPLVTCDPDASMPCLGGRPVPSSSGPPAGDGGASDAGAAGTTLTGSVVLVDSPGFELPGSPVTTSVQVLAQAEAGGFVDTRAFGGTFTLEGILTEPWVWVGAVMDVPADALPTLSVVENTMDQPVVVTMARETAIDTVYSLLPLPIVREPSTGQVVLRFVALDTGSPVPGIEVIAPVAETIIYDDAQSFTNDAGATGPEGMAIVPNVAAVSWPGSLQAVVIRGAAIGEVSVQVAQDSVTLLTVGL